MLWGNTLDHHCFRANLSLISLQLSYVSESLTHSLVKHAFSQKTSTPPPPPPRSTYLSHTLYINFKKSSLALAKGRHSVEQKSIIILVLGRITVLTANQAVWIVFASLRVADQACVQPDFCILSALHRPGKSCSQCRHYINFLFFIFADWRVCMLTANRRLWLKNKKASPENPNCSQVNVDVSLVLPISIR